MNSTKLFNVYGKHFFLANRASIKPSQSIIQSSLRSLIQKTSSHTSSTLKSSFIPIKLRSLIPKKSLFNSVSSKPTVGIRHFSSTGVIKFIRVSNYNYKRNYDTLKQALIFGGLFITGTTLITPYLFQCTPLSYFNRHPSHLVYGLIGLNLIVFGLWRLPQYWKFLNRYALLEKDSLYSKWSILGSSFSHQEIWHLAMNMLALYSFGTSLSGIIGASTFLQLYLNAGVVSSIVSIAYPILFRIPITAASLGASGSLFGVLGTFSYLIPQAKIMLFVFPIPGGAWVAFLGSVAWNAAGCALKWGRFDYAAHLGGSVVGIVYGWWISQKIEKQRQVRNKAFRW